jgi:site-specific DNA recombinase
MRDQLTVTAAGYVRVSTAKQAEEGLSIEEQKRRICAHADANGWVLETIFEDAGVSGGVAFAKRPEGGKALKLAAEFDRLIVTKLDRFGRSAQDLLTSMSKLEDAGCAFVSLTETIDTSTSVGRMVRTLLAGVAEFEHDRIKERIRDGSRAKFVNGRIHGGPRRYGYEYGDEGLSVVEAERAIVRRIFSEFLGGSSITGITRKLVEHNVPTVRGGKWQTTTVSGILRGARYAGMVESGDERISGNHEAIIDMETFERAQQLLAANVGKRPGGRPPKAHHLFRKGLLRCSCGAAMLPRSDHSTGYYVCHTRAHLGREHCDQPTLRREAVDGGISGTSSGSGWTSRRPEPSWPRSASAA